MENRHEQEQNAPCKYAWQDMHTDTMTATDK